MFELFGLLLSLIHVAIQMLYPRKVGTIDGMVNAKKMSPYNSLLKLNFFSIFKRKIGQWPYNLITLKSYVNYWFSHQNPSQKLKIIRSIRPSLRFFFSLRPSLRFFFSLNKFKKFQRSVDIWRNICRFLDNL